MTEFLHLTEAEQKELDELAKKTDEASLDRFLDLLKKEAVNPDGTPWSEHELRESIKRMRPDFTEAQIDIFVNGEAPREPSMVETSHLRGLDRFKDLSAKFGGAKVRGMGGSPSDSSDRDALILSLMRTHPDWTDRQIEIFLNPEGK